jgi:hypothetical protein
VQGELMQEEERLEAEYWWFVGRRSIIDRLLRRFRVDAGLAIDVGCGSGRNLEVPAGSRPSRRTATRCRWPMAPLTC